MKLEHCKIEPANGGGETSACLVFSVPYPLTVDLVQEIGRRIENFLMPLHTSAPVAVAGPDDVGPIPPQPEPVAEITPPIRRTRGRLLPPVEVPPTSRSFLQSPEVAEMADRALAHSRAAILGTAKVPPAPVVGTPAAEPAPARRRTRTPAPEAAPEITDIELAKAASEAAAVVSPEEVKAVIAAMGVTTVNQIEGQENRQSFLAKLRHLVEQFAGEVK